MTERVVFFDAGGTLLRVGGSVGEVYCRFAARYGVRASAEDLERRFARAFRAQPPLAFAGAEAAALAGLEQDWWRRLVLDVVGRFPGFDAYFAEVFEYFRGGEAWEIYDDVLPALGALRSGGWRLGVISNFDSRLEDLLGALGLDGYFDSVHISSRVGAAKPDPAIFRAALAAHAVAPGQAWHVGDSLREDVGGAAAAGLRAVWLDRQGGLPEDPRRTRITRLDQLVDLIMP
jgi:putative hydrolase of the HAD superfamily